MYWTYGTNLNTTLDSTGFITELALDGSMSETVIPPKPKKSTSLVNGASESINMKSRSSVSIANYMLHEWCMSPFTSYLTTSDPICPLVFSSTFH